MEANGTATAQGEQGQSATITPDAAKAQITAGQGEQAQQQSTTTTAEEARTQIDALEADRAYMAACFAGDKAKVAERDRLYSLAHPADPDVPLPGDGIVRAKDEPSAQEWLAPPREAHEYNFHGLQVEKPEHAALQSEIAAALHSEGVPQFAVAAVCDVIGTSVERGLPDDEALERSMLTGRAELELRHGKERAEQMIAAAAKTFERLDKRDPRIGDWLCGSGAGNSAYVIETLSRLARP